MKLDILAIGAHPDDVELSCSGTLIKHASLGHKTGVLDLTRGELGTRGSAEIRDQEAAAAAKILGLSVRENIALADGFFENNKESQLKIIEIIRKYKPEIVLLNAVKDRHPDHGKGSDLASVACFLSGLPKIETTFDGVNQQAWRPKAVYHYIQYQNLDPDFLVDISGFIDKKMESVMAYGSQFFNPNSEDPETPITSLQFLNGIKNRNSDMGKYIGVDYAEGYTVERYIGVKDLFQLI